MGEILFNIIMKGARTYGMDLNDLDTDPSELIGKSFRELNSMLNIQKRTACVLKMLYGLCFQPAKLAENKQNFKP